MNNTLAPPRLALRAETAADLMTLNPVSISEHASVHEALVLLTDKAIKAAPVIDDAGRPIGVLSGTDILVHDRETVQHLAAAPEYYHRADLHMPSGEPLGKGFQVERVDPTPVRDLMTPAVFSVAIDAPAATVVENLVTMKVHRLFVVDDAGILVGVISALDVLRHLRP
jgi:CBS-domain-containing membrane protein